MSPAARTAVKLALAVGALAWVASRVDPAELATTVRGASWPYLALSLCTFVAGDLLVAHRWNRLLAGIGMRVPFARLFRAYLEGRFLGFFLPSSVASDLYRGAALARERGSGSQVASSIVLERLLGLASTVVLGLAAAAALPARFLGAGRSTWLLASSAAVLSVGAAFLQADRIAARFLPFLPRRWTGVRRVLEDLTRAFAAYRARVGLLAETFVLSLVIQAARGLSVWVIARAVADRTPFAVFLLLVPYVYLVNLLPFASSRIGIEQGVFVALFAAAGMAHETALAISLLSVAVSFVAAIPGGFGLVTGRAGLSPAPPSRGGR